MIITSITKMMICISLANFLVLPCWSQTPREEWVARYNGPENGRDIATALAVDSAGNVYVTGSSGTIKYAPDGNETWVVSNNGLGIYFGPSALEVDSAGNVYVIGFFYDSDNNNDYCTVKYDLNGNEMWVARYNSSGIEQDDAKALSVDSAGNVYVTGFSQGGSATVKYDPDGNELWVTRDNGLNANAIVVDKDGNVYVTGSSSGSNGWNDYSTVKYDTDGQELWVARYNGLANFADWANDLAVDKDGNVYVTGGSDYSGSGGNYATVKYDPDGHELWVVRYNGPSNKWEGATALEVDSAGNVYVTGSSWGRGTYEDYATVKYDPKGNEMWVARYKGSDKSVDTSEALAVDNAGNVYVTGVSEGDYTTVKYSPETIVDFENFEPGDQGKTFGVDIDDKYAGLDWAYHASYKIETWGHFTVQDKNAFGGNSSYGNSIPGASDSKNWSKVKAGALGKGAKITRRRGECFEFMSMKLFTQDHPAFIDEVSVTAKTCDGTFENSEFVNLKNDNWIEVTAADLGIEARTLLKAIWFNGFPEDPKASKFGLDDLVVNVLPKP
jgi:sugar lactone lactonase YvrE